MYVKDLSEQASSGGNATVETVKSPSKMSTIQVDANAPSCFANIQAAPPIAVFKLTADYKNDQNPNKINLGVGAFRTEKGEPWVLPAVKKAEQAIVNNAQLNKEYWRES